MNVWFVWLSLLLVSCASTQTDAKRVSCIANAERNSEGHCECSEGFHGNGGLCCIPDDHKICMVEADPVIYTMNGDLIPVDIPCPYILAEVHTMGPIYDETLNAYVAGEYKRNGLMYTDYLKLEYRERYNDIHTIVEIYDGQLTINGKAHNRSVPWASEKYEVRLDYNETSDNYRLISMGTTIVHFVPPSQRTDQQIAIPGVCIGVARHSSLYNVGMCNERRRALQRSSENKGFHFLQAGVVEHMIRRMPMDQDVGPRQVQHTCLALNKMRTPCGDKWNPSMAACTNLIMHLDIRFCLTVQGIDVLEAFQKCTEAHCGVNKDSCDFITSQAINKCVRVKPDCHALY